MSTTAVEQINPATLLVDANVRIDSRLDRDFVASIKDLGVLVPIVAVRTAEGAIRVRFGNRRTLGAIEAGLPAVPVMVVADEGTDDASVIERIIGQFAENTFRTSLSALESAGVVSQLLDLGLSAAAVQRRTRIKRPVIDAAVSVMGSDLAKAAAGRYEFLTLPQAATIAQYEDDPEAVKALVAAAKEGEVSFDHVATKLRDSLAERLAYAEARAALEASGLSVVEETSWERHLSYLIDDQGEAISEEAHRDCPGHAAFLRLDWEHDGSEDQEDENYRAIWHPVYICADPAANGHKSRSESRSAKEKPTGEAAEAAKAERRRVIQHNKAWRSAETVRREWLTTFLARKSPPKGALRYVLGELAVAHWRLTNKIGQGHELACRLLGLENREALVTAMASANDNRSQVIALALVLGAYEDFTSTETWRNPTPQDRDYFHMLVEWGYQLSDIEASIMGEEQGGAEED